MLNITGNESVSDVDRLEEDAGLKRFFAKCETKFSGLRNREFRKGRERTFPSPSRIFSFLNRFNSDREDQERQSTPKGQSKILPVADEFNKLVQVNSDIIAAAQELTACKTATLDMDNNQIITNKRNAKYSYKKVDPEYPGGSKKSNFQEFEAVGGNLMVDFGLLLSLTHEIGARKVLSTYHPKEDINLFKHSS